MSGNILEIYKYGSAVLRETAINITEMTDELRQLIEDMYTTMYDDDGIGLAANQIGRAIHLCVIGDMLDATMRKQFCVINGEILDGSGSDTLEEGCLSIPGIHEEVTRYDAITLRYQDEHLIEHTETFSGTYARVIQHELDHLHGILFIDHISPVKRSLLKKKLAAIAETQKHHR